MSLIQKEGSGLSAVIRHGRIRDVNPSTWCVDIEFEGGGVLHDIPVASPYFHQENGEGMFCSPEVDAHCLVLDRVAEGSRPVVLAFVPLRFTSDGEGDQRPESDHSGGRGPHVPGGMFMQGRDGNYVRVLRGGMVEIGASEGAFTHYYPIQDLIRTVCANWELIWSGSRLRAQTLNGPGIPTNGPTPTRLDLHLQQSAESPPIIHLTAGYVEDDATAERSLGDGAPEDIITRFLVYDPTTAARAQAANLPPSPDQAKIAIRFDRNGNAESIFAGRQLFQAHGRRMYLTDNDIVLVNGSRQQTITGPYDEEVGGDYTSSVRGSRTLQSTGPIVIDCERLELRERTARVNSVQGSRAEEVGGSYVLRVATENVRSTGGSDSDTAARDRSVLTGGKYAHTVLHAIEPLTILQNAVAHALSVMDGKILTHAQQGDIEFIIGPRTSPYMRVKIHNDPRAPNEIGRFSVTWLNPRQEFVFDGITGAVQMSNSLGEIVLSATGQVRMGAPEGVGAGKVLTTATQPLCFVTGAPMVGCESCQAAGPPGVGPAVPAPGPVANLPAVEVPLP